jgi:L-ascorbate metabolism protein UlaG (beta-lactamase superfamily)
MKLTWYGTASLILEDQGTRIAFDPFCGLPVRPGGDPGMSLPDRKDFQQVSHVFVTHGHLDHICHIPEIYRDISVTVHCTATPKETLLKRGLAPEKISQIAPGWSTDLGPFHIMALQGRHCVFDLPLLRKTILSARFFRHPIHLFQVLKLHLTHPENGEILFYEIENRGFRLQIMGSMNLDEHTDYPTGADLLILALQGRSDQDTYALDFVERLKPQAILLDHYDNTFPPMSGEVNPSGFINNVREKYGIPCDTLKFKKGVLLNE